MAGAFYDLRIYQKGFELLMEIYKITASFPKEELYSLTTQIRNSANSIIANIAESHGRYYFADKVRVLYTARGETEETRSHLRVAFGWKYINQQTFDKLDKEYEGLGKGISVYIKTLKQTDS